MDVGAWINGDDDDLATQPSVVSYRGPDGQIFYFGSDDEIAELLLNDLDASFAGTGAPGIHVRSVNVAANDESVIDSYAGAVSVAAAVSGTVSGSIAVGATVATNKIDNLVHADLMHLSTGLFTTGSTDVSMTPSATTVDGNATTLYDYAKTAERRGDIKVTAGENAEIDSVAFAAALSAAFGAVFSGAIAGAGASAINTINNLVDAHITDSIASSFGRLARAADDTVIGITPADLIVDASNTSTIDSEVVAVSAAVSVQRSLVQVPLVSHSLKTVLAIRTRHQVPIRMALTHRFKIHTRLQAAM